MVYCHFPSLKGVFNLKDSIVLIVSVDVCDKLVLVILVVGLLSVNLLLKSLTSAIKPKLSIIHPSMADIRSELLICFAFNISIIFCLLDSHFCVISFSI